MARHTIPTNTGNLSKKHYGQNVIVLALAIVFFCLDFYFRMSPTLVVQPMMHHFSIPLAGFSAFASLFFIGYSLMQIPSGLIVQTFNVTKALFIVMCVCALSFIIFIKTDVLWLAYVMRLLNGLTSAFSLIGVLYIAQQYFPIRWFGFISGLAISLGTLGSSLFQVLSSFLLERFDWQFSLSLFAYISLVLCLPLLFVKLRKHEEKPMLTKLPSWQQGLLYLKHHTLWLNAIVGGLFYLPTSIYVSLFGVPFLEHVYHFDKKVAATSVTILFLGWAIGSPIFGAITVFFHRVTTIIILTALVCVGLALALVYYNVMSVTYVYGLLLLLGIFSGAQVLVWRLFVQLVPRNIEGLGIAMTNMIIMGVVALGHSVVGLLLDGKGMNANFKFSLSLLPVAFLLTFLLTLLLNYFIRQKERQCGH